MNLKGTGYLRGGVIYNEGGMHQDLWRKEGGGKKNSTRV